MLIKEIKAEDTWKLRREVMWPNENLDYVRLVEDDQGIHFGLTDHDKLISVVSLFIKDNSAQFRKFATAKGEQGKGYGTILLRFVMDKVQDLNIDRIWCNAREERSVFYEKFGMKETNQRFVKGGLKYVIMEKNFP
ncbi:GNAT family N-acetyltransferase [Fulvivirgaceae bacterium BMA10]|uniref:GNAT family N-acetyltransferase n=1 Tax=Splendidivirga corallicola TaxID=3051826 RepID=A0ABT8KNF6_9BACT|nr:GNAT family N-acetyltransferase [Fulvivirgaceae bacterium BMA10]